MRRDAREFEGFVRSKYYLSPESVSLHMIWTGTACFQPQFVLDGGAG